MPFFVCPAKLANPARLIVEEIEKRLAVREGYSHSAKWWAQKSTEGQGAEVLGCRQTLNRLYD
jgi:hypothetical protein